MPTYKTPGVYVEEISTMPPSVAEVETAIPAFIGFTEKGAPADKDSPIVAKRISSLKEYEDFFGKADPQKDITIIIEQVLDDGKQVENVSDVSIKKPSNNVMYYALQLYYSNGGGPCYILSVGNYAASGAADGAMYKRGIDVSSMEDEPTLIVLPDAPFWLDSDSYYDVMNYAVKECTRLGDRFAIIDVKVDGDRLASIELFRNKIVSSESVQLKYSAAYFPYLNTELSYVYDDKDDNSFTILSPGTEQIARDLETAREKAKNDRAKANTAKTKADSLKRKADKIDPTDPTKAQADTDAKTAQTDFENLDKTATQSEQAATALAQQSASPKKFGGLTNLSRNQVKRKIDEMGIQLTPCAAMAGVYAAVDNARGVWKAPANVGLTAVSSVNMTITNDDQKDMNIDATAGKSINAIRPFIGKGVLVWGARTLDGNSNEWRYINVRRFFNMVEESIKKSTYWAVFEANDVNTWTKVRAMIENYLILKWKDGALAGAKPDDAFFVRVGLGQTMSPLDVLEGRMIIEVGLAAVRPAEFIILKFSHKMQTS